MAGRNHVNHAFRPQSGEHTATCVARLAFEIPLAGFSAFRMDKKSVSVGETADERLIAIRLAASQRVIDMDNVQTHPKLGGEFPENLKQANRVGAARDSSADLLARTYHAPGANVLPNAVDQNFSLVVAV